MDKINELINFIYFLLDTFETFRYNLINISIKFHSKHFIDIFMHLLHIDLQFHPQLERVFSSRSGIATHR